jgi:hypothetical protein
MEEKHELGSKSILSNVTIPSGKSCLGDLEIALDTIFNHPNVGPFISKQLIQKLVTSNPSPAYVQRVAEIFNDNGEGVRGDLKAVVRAILLDEEALAEVDLSSSFGKVKEPVVRLASFMRSFSAKIDAEYSLKDHYAYGQMYLHSGTVFNFYRPDYTSGSELYNQNLVAPELQIATASNITNLSNTWRTLIYNKMKIGEITDNSSFYNFDFNYEYNLLPDSPDELIEHFNLLTMQGNMSDSMKSSLKEFIIAQMGQYRNDGQKRALYHTLFIIMNTAQQNFFSNSNYTNPTTPI